MDNKNALQTAQGMGLIPAEMKKQIQGLFEVTNRPGFESGIDRDSIVIPRVKLLQGLSDEVKQDPKTYSAGMIINSVTKETLPAGFIPLAQMPTSWIYFNPRDKKHKNFVPDFGPGDVVWQCADPNDPRVKEHGEWKGDDPPAATEYMNFLCYFVGFPIPLVLGFAKTSFGSGKSFFTMALGFGGAMYSRKYELSALAKNKSGNDFFILSVRAAGKCDEDELEIGKMLYDVFAPKLKDLKVHAPDAEHTES